MPIKPKNSGTRVLKKYEWTNLLFFLSVILALGFFVALVFRTYSTPSDDSEDEGNGDRGIVSVVVVPEMESCVFHMGIDLFVRGHQYRSRADIPVTDDGFVKALFAIPGVVDVSVDKKMLIIRKTPEASFDAVQLEARDVINNHLHIHQ